MKKKKPTSKIDRKHLERVIKLVSHHIWIAGSNVMEDIHVEGLETVGRHARTTNSRYALVDAVNTALRRIRRDWQFVYYVFSKDEEGVPVFSYDIATIRHCNAVELDLSTNNLIRDKIDELGDDDAISYGWVAFPNMTVDVDAMILPFEDFFSGQGCYDLEKRKRVVAAKRARGLSTKQLAEDYREVYCKISEEHPKFVNATINNVKCGFKQVDMAASTGFTVMLKEPALFLRWTPSQPAFESIYQQWVKEQVDSKSPVVASENLKNFFEQFEIDTTRIDAFSLMVD